MPNAMPNAMPPMYARQWPGNMPPNAMPPAGVADNMQSNQANVLFKLFGSQMAGPAGSLPAIPQQGAVFNLEELEKKLANK
jgi:hypothetical protein